MKKRITGIVAVKVGEGMKKFKIKGWKVNPYIFIHKTTSKNGIPVRHPSWNITFIPTGYAVATRIQLTNSLTLSKFRAIIDKWFPSWIMKICGKKMNVTEEMRIRHKAMWDEIRLHQQAKSIWEI